MKGESGCFGRGGGKAIREVAPHPARDVSRERLSRSDSLAFRKLAP
jgi:hypothetical protein